MGANQSSKKELRLSGHDQLDSAIIVAKKNHNHSHNNQQFVHIDHGELKSQYNNHKSQKSGSTLRNVLTRNKHQHQQQQQPDSLINDENCNKSELHKIASDHDPNIDDSFGFEPATRVGRNSLNHQLNNQLDGKLDSSYYVTTSLRKTNINKTEGNNYVDAPVMVSKHISPITNTRLNYGDKNNNNSNNLANAAASAAAQQHQQYQHRLIHHYYYVEPTNENQPTATTTTSASASTTTSTSTPKTQMRMNSTPKKDESIRMMMADHGHVDEAGEIARKNGFNRNQIEVNSTNTVNSSTSTRPIADTNKTAPNNTYNNNNNNNDIYKSSTTNQHGTMSNRSTIKEQQVDVANELLLHQYNPSRTMSTSFNNGNAINAFNNHGSKLNNRTRRSVGNQPLGEIDNTDQSVFNNTRHFQVTNLSASTNDPYQLSYQQAIMTDPYQHHQQQSPRIILDSNYYHQSFNMSPINQYGQYNHSLQHQYHAHQRLQTQPQMLNNMHHQIPSCFNYQAPILDFHRASAQNYQDCASKFEAANNLEPYPSDNSNQLSRLVRPSRSRPNIASVGSQTLDTRGKKSNPFSSLFSKDKSQQSNTIHSTRRNKSPSRGAMTARHDFHNQRSAPSSLKRVKSSPATAKQASYEAMRTIDMYLIRQIARSCMVSRRLSVEEKVI